MAGHIGPYFDFNISRPSKSQLNVDCIDAKEEIS